MLVAYAQYCNKHVGLVKVCTLLFGHPSYIVVFYESNKVNFVLENISFLYNYLGNYQMFWGFFFSITHFSEWREILLRYKAFRQKARNRFLHFSKALVLYELKRPQLNANSVFRLHFLCWNLLHLFSPLLLLQNTSMKLLNLSKLRQRSFILLFN